MKRIFSAIGVAVLSVTLLTGCHTPMNCVVIGSGTTVGFDVSEAPATQTPQATLAYKRVELAVVPVSTNGVVPDVIMDFSLKTSLFTAAGGIYSRIAIGLNATTQTPAVLMMSKDRSGNVITNLSVLIPRFLTTNPTK